MSHPNLTLVKSLALKPLFTVLRATSTPPCLFITIAKRIHRILVEEALATLPSTPLDVLTPCGTYSGCEITCLKSGKVAAISIIRAGDSLLESVREILPDVRVGKILIQRDESTALPKLYYSKLPKSISSMERVLICDPMLATGGSVMMAIGELVKAGVEESRIVFVNVVSCPEGLQALHRKFPGVAVVSAALDDCIDSNKYICPGLGDYGDRFFNSD